MEKYQTLIHSIEYFKRHKSLYNTSVFPETQNILDSFSRRPTVFPNISLYIGASSFIGQYFPSTKYNLYNTPEIPQNIVQYSFLKCKGSLGTNINP